MDKEKDKIGYYEYINIIFSIIILVIYPLVIINRGKNVLGYLILLLLILVPGLSIYNLIIMIYGLAKKINEKYSLLIISLILNITGTIILLSSLGYGVFVSLNLDLLVLIAIISYSLIIIINLYSHWKKNG